MFGLVIDLLVMVSALWEYGNGYKKGYECVEWKDESREESLTSN